MLNYSVQESKKAQFSAYTSDTPVTLKQSQGHQTYNYNVDLEQGYNHAKFERFHFNHARGKTNVKVLCFFPPQIRKVVHYLPRILAKVLNSGVIVIYMTCITILRILNLIG